MVKGWTNLSNTDWLDQHKPALSKTVKSIGWIADGIDASERQAVQRLVSVEALLGLESAPAPSNQTWVLDGLDDPEASAIATVVAPSFLNKAHGQLLIQLALPEDLETLDAVMVNILARMAANLPSFRPINGSNSPDLARLLLKLEPIDLFFAYPRSETRSPEPLLMIRITGYGSGTDA